MGEEDPSGQGRQHDSQRVGQRHAGRHCVVGQPVDGRALADLGVGEHDQLTGAGQRDAQPVDRDEADAQDVVPCRLQTGGLEVDGQETERGVLLGRVRDRAGEVVAQRPLGGVGELADSAPVRGAAQPHER